MNEPKTNLKKQSRKLKLVMKRVDSLEEVQVSLLVATMCDEIQNMMFKRIFKPNVQRKVKDIEGIRNRAVFYSCWCLIEFLLEELISDNG